MLNRTLTFVVALVGFQVIGSADAQDCKHADMDTAIRQAANWIARDRGVAVCWQPGPIIGEMLCGQTTELPAFHVLIGPSQDTQPYDAVVDVYAYNKEHPFTTLLDSRWCNVCLDECSHDPHAFDRLHEVTLQLPQEPMGGDLVLGAVNGVAAAIWSPYDHSVACRRFDLSDRRELDVPLRIIGSDFDDGIYVLAEATDLCGERIDPLVVKNSGIPTLIRAGTGDDSIHWKFGGNVEVYGGPGQDFIELGKVGIAHGEDGGDVLFGEDEAQLYGDNHSDHLCVRAGVYRTVRVADGGDAYDWGCNLPENRQSIEDPNACARCGQ